MRLSRRSFIADSAAAGILAPWLSRPEMASALSAASIPPGSPTAGETYWKNLYAGSAHRGQGLSTPDPNRDPRIVQYDEKHGLRWAEEIQPAELPSFREDAVVTMEMTGFRPGSEDKSRLAKVKFAQLHLSCQRVTGSEFLGPLVWAALATVFTNKASKLPAEQQLSWKSLAGGGSQPSSPAGSSGGPQLSHMVLNQGAGHMSVNITATPPTSALDHILSGLVTGTRILTPLLGFPGITLPALQNFYSFYGQLEKSRPSDFLLNSAQKDVVVTQQGADNSLVSSTALKLLNGAYILVPRAQEADLQKQMDKLTIQNGYIIERDAKGIPDELIAQAVPTVSYVVLNVKVQPASDFPATSTVTDPMLDSAPSGSDSGGSSGSGSSSKKTGSGKGKEGGKKGH
jgi:hypothetical protein